MAWRDNDPELAEMRRTLARLQGYMSDSARCGLAEAAARSALGLAMVRSPDVKVVVVSEATRTFSFARRTAYMLLLELRRNGRMTLLFEGRSDDLRYELGAYEVRGTYRLPIEELERLRERAGGGDDDGEPPPPPDAIDGDGGAGEPPPPPPDAIGGNGRAGEPPAGGGGNGNGGNQGRDGPGGLVEVVSHPVLFSVSAEDYRTLLENY